MHAPLPTTSEVRAISVARWYDPLIAVALIAGTFFALSGTQISHAALILSITLVTSAYYFLSELSRAPWRFAERPRARFADILERTITKFLGVLVGISGILFALWLLPIYRNPRYLDFIEDARLPFLAFIIPASFILILVTEYILGEKRDGTFQFGLAARLRFNEIDPRVLLDGVLEWLMRGIFLLINFFAVYNYVVRLRTNGLPDPADGFVSFVTGVDSVIFALILFSILPGYVFASRLIGTDLKRIDRTWFAWTITLISYPPLNSAVGGNWTRTTPPPETQAILDGTPAWAYFTLDIPILLYLLAGAILFFGLIHLWAEATLGVRSANLAQRGIITTGPFALTKHPVYVSKCFQWACIHLPILNGLGFLSGVQSGLLFFFVCVIFASRSLAEERLLAHDPQYVAYARYMDAHGLFAFVGRVLPFMSFGWRYEYWKRHGHLSTS